MGMKEIWDGEDLPPIGCSVLIHLGSLNEWVRHIVSGVSVEQDDEYPALYRVLISVEPSSDKRSSNNARQLYDVRPLDWRGEKP